MTLHPPGRPPVLPAAETPASHDLTGAPILRLEQRAALTCPPNGNSLVEDHTNLHSGTRKNCSTAKDILALFSVCITTHTVEYVSPRAHQKLPVSHHWHVRLHVVQHRQEHLSHFMQPLIGAHPEKKGMSMEQCNTFLDKMAHQPPSCWFAPGTLRSLLHSRKEATHPCSTAGISTATCIVGIVLDSSCSARLVRDPKQSLYRWIRTTKT